ncbi:MAG: 3-oxoacid CoA-transferase subunit B, partial [Ostreibacterium sp.]
MFDTEKLLKRAAKELTAGQTVNLGIGLPTKIIPYLDDDLEVMLHSENGVLGAWKKDNHSDIDPFLIDAGGQYINCRAGHCFFDSAVSFAMIRRGLLDIAIIGTFEVDEQGSLANWKIPNKFSPGIGGAMELVQKTKKVIVLSTHVDKRGQPKILKKCTLPITARSCASRIITDKAVIDVTSSGLLLTEIAEGLSVEALQLQTE